MSLYIDSIYVPRLSYKLENFKKKSNFLWNCKCPVCGDSQIHKRKARGYFYKVKDSICYHCHNCGYTASLGNFLKRIDPPLYKEYQLDIFKDKNVSTQVYVDAPKQVYSAVSELVNDVINLPTIESLVNTHKAKQYLVNRKIPKKYFSEIYFCDDFKGFVDEMKPGHDKKLINREQRIIIPFIDEENHLVGFQGRALDEKSKIRYMSIKLDDLSQKMVYGLNRLDLDKTIYVLEGPFDSLFVENSMAITNSALQTVVYILGRDKKYCLVFDNQPRNKDVVHNMRSAIDQGLPIFIWPRELKEYKDINAAILGGYTSSEIQSIIDTNTYNDQLKAKLKLVEWINE